jgi:hypothetical protein
LSSLPSPLPLPPLLAAAAAAALTAAVATTTTTTSVINTAAAAAAAAALAVATTAMDGGTLRVCDAHLGDLHTHTNNHRHSGDCWEGLLKEESFSTFN